MNPAGDHLAINGALYHLAYRKINAMKAADMSTQSYHTLVIFWHLLFYHDLSRRASVQVRISVQQKRPL
jgi:hypothetical protein